MTHQWRTVRGHYRLDQNTANIQAFRYPSGSWGANVTGHATNPVTNMSDEVVLCTVWGDTEAEAVGRAQIVADTLNAAEKAHAERDAEIEHWRDMLDRARAEIEELRNR